MGASTPASPPSNARVPAPRRREREPYGRALAVGLLVSVALHLAVFLLWSGAEGDSLRRAMSAPELVILPPHEEEESAAAPATMPTVELPAPAEPVLRPAEPVMAEAATAEPTDEPVWIPHEVPPRLLNPAEVQDMLAGAVLRGLGEAGLDQVAVLWLYVDRTGEVRKLQLRRSTGSPRLDAIVQGVAGRMEFSPALNQGKTVGVWISQPVRFSFLAAAVDGPGS